MTDDRDLTLRDVVDHAPLGLRALTPDADLDVPVLGAHTIEIDRPARWLQPGWLMLTTGMRFPTDPEPASAQRQLVEELAQARVAGLLFGEGVHLDRTPQSLVVAAQRAGLPVVAVPAEVPFLHIEEFVNARIHSSDAGRTRRSLWLQTDLLERLGDPQPVSSVVRRLGALIRGTAALYEESGRIVASTGEGPVRLIWAEIRDRPNTRHRFDVGRWHVVSRPVTLGGAGYTIVLASRRAASLDDLGEAILDSAQRVLGALGGARALGATQYRAESAHLLRTLEDGITGAEGRRMWERLRAFRFLPHYDLRALVAIPVEGMTGPRTDIAAVLDDVHEEAVACGLGLLLRLDEAPGAEMPAATVYALAADAAELTDLIEVLCATHHVGLSEPFADVASTRRHIRDARRAVLVAMRRHLQHVARSADRAFDTQRAPRGLSVRFEDVDVATWLLAGRSQDDVHAKVRQRFGELLDREDLRVTVLAYLGCRLDVSAAARTLFVHPNTVRYRLRRVEEIIDGPIDSPAVIANLYLAFHDDIAVSPREPLD